jgi:hypothetical protein
MNKDNLWLVAVLAGGMLTMANITGVFFARSVFGLAGFVVVAVVCLAWVLQALLENKPLKFASITVSLLAMVFGSAILGLRLVGYFQKMGLVSLVCAGLNVVAGVTIIILTLAKKNN